MILSILGGIAALYMVGVLWQTYGRGDFQTTYNRFWARVVNAVGEGAITIGARCYLYAEGHVLDDGAQIHERFHFEQQWKKLSVLFPPLYLSENLMKGYKCNKYEEAARKAAGQVSQCGGSPKTT